MRIIIASLALLLVATPALAFSRHSRSYSYEYKQEVSIDQRADVDSHITIDVNTGGNKIKAGDDLRGAGKRKNIYYQIKKHIKLTGHSVDRETGTTIVYSPST